MGRNRVTITSDQQNRICIPMRTVDQSLTNIVEQMLVVSEVGPSLDLQTVVFMCDVAPLHVSSYAR